MIGKPWDLSTDCGPVIDETARAGIAEHIQQARAEGRLIHELKTPNSGTYIAPTLIKVNKVGDLEREINAGAWSVLSVSTDLLLKDRDRGARPLALDILDAVDAGAKN